MKKTERFSALLHKLVHSNRAVAVFSIVAALVLWLVISISENPQRTVTISGVPLNINTQGTIVETLGMNIVASDTTAVDVVVSGPSYIVSSLKSSDLNVSASLSEVTGAGTYKLKLSAGRGSSKTGYDIITVSPETVTVTFDVVDTKVFEIELVALGASATDGLVAEKPVIGDSSKSSIAVSGPRTVMSRIAKITAEAQFDGALSKTTSKNADLKFYDENGEELGADDTAMLELPFTSVDITVPIFKEKQVPVIMNSKSSAAVKAIPYEFSSETVTVRGEPSVIDSMTYAELELLDASRLSVGNTTDGKLVLEPSFVLPSSVRTVSSEHFKLTLDLSDYTSRMVRVTSIQTSGVEDGYKAAFSVSYIEITVCGPRAAVSNVLPSNITVTVDCTGKAAGVYSLPCTVSIPNYPSLWSVGTVTASVTVEKN